MKLARGVVGVFTGYGLMTLILRFPGPQPGLFVFAFWTVIGALLSGFVTAWIAGEHELPFASTLGLAMIATSIRASRPGWYETSIAGCGPVAALLGAALRMLMKARGPG